MIETAGQRMRLLQTAHDLRQRGAIQARELAIICGSTEPPEESGVGRAHDMETVRQRTVEVEKQRAPALLIRRHRPTSALGRRRWRAQPYGPRISRYCADARRAAACRDAGYQSSALPEAPRQAGCRASPADDAGQTWQAHPPPEARA